ncbi:ATP-binding protein [Oleidesulfovibrio sp.]|uniref:ATP-binding protein n=1 Tax=Oleidesulfovibrio sp. TaxID=2909707 RepID=UPI003A8A4444
MSTRFPLFHGIWARLLLAFGASAAVTVAAVMIALFLLENSSDIFATITQKQLPELAQVTEFAETSGQIMAIAPNLASATDEESQAHIRSELDTLLRHFRLEIEQLERAYPQLRTELDTLLHKLRTNLTALQNVVAARLGYEEEMARRMERLRWLYTDMLGEIEPLSQDLNYNLDAEIERLSEAKGQRAEKLFLSRLRANRKAKNIIESIGSNGDMLVSLLLQTSSSQHEAQVDNLAALARDTTTSLKLNLEEFSGGASALTLRQLLNEIFLLADGPDGIFALKKAIITSEVTGQQILTENRQLVGQLRESVGSIVTRTQKQALESAAVTQQKLERARWYQLGLVFLSLVISASVMWFYVRGSIVARLNALANSMQAIAGGDLAHPVPQQSKDEIGQMTAALRVFRDTAVAVENANAQAIIDNAAVGLIIADSDGIIRFFNPMAATLFAAEERGMSGRSLLEFVAEDDSASVKEACMKAFDGEYDQIQSVYRGFRSNGTEFPVEVVIRSIQQRARKNLMITIHDVSEREEAEELLRRRVQQKTEYLSHTNAKLRQEVKERRRVQDELVQAGKLAALGQLSAGIAHELNQPLSAIRYYLHNAKLLLQRGQLDVHEENIHKISDLSERMAKLINHLKSFARLPSNKLQPVDVVPTIEHALYLFDRRIAEDSITIEKRYTDAPQMVSAEDIRLEQVLVNILGNAIDAVSQQPLENRLITLDIIDNDTDLTIEITDSGPGIPQEVKEAIFDPFYTTKEIGKGLGLGLSISYNIVKDMKGEIKAADAETGGTKFSLSFQKVEKS